MINCNFSKIVATMGPAIAKETALARIMNHVDIFVLNLAYGIEENNKKNIEAIKKLDNSKVLILDTQGLEISTQNIDNIELKKGQYVNIKFSSVKKDKSGNIYINYPKLDDIPKGTYVSINNQKKILMVESFDTDYLKCKIVSNGVVRNNSSIVFEKMDLNVSFYNELRKKELLWGIRNGINIFMISVNSSSELDIYRKLLNATGKEVKIMAKIDNLDSLKNINDIINSADGLIIDRIKLETYMSLDKINSEKKRIISLCHSLSKPVMVSGRVMESLIIKRESVSKEKAIAIEEDLFDTDSDEEIVIPEPVEIKKQTLKASTKERNIIADDVINGVDGLILVDETILGDNTYELIVEVNKIICDNQKHVDISEIQNDIQKKLKKGDCGFENFIIYTAYDIAEKMNARIILCVSEKGFTPTKLSSLKPNIPIVAFTKNDDVYRFINLHRAVRGYKIASEFNSENIKRIGKEIVRITFKGDITLEDKIIIVHTSSPNSVIVPSATTRNVLNGIEIYRFKDL